MQLIDLGEHCVGFEIAIVGALDLKVPAGVDLEHVLARQNLQSLDHEWLTQVNGQPALAVATDPCVPEAVPVAVNRSLRPMLRIERG